MFSLVGIKGTSILDQVFNKSLDIEYQKQLLCSLRQTIELWEWLDKNHLADIYWKNVFNLHITYDEAYNVAIEKLDKYGNYILMVDVLALQTVLRRADRIKTEDIVLALGRAPHQKNIENKLNAMSTHHASELFALLQDRDDINENDLLNLEILWFDLFSVGYSNLKPKAIERNLVKSPEFFIDIIDTAFIKKTSLENRDPSEQERLRRASKLATSIYLWLEKIYPFSSEQELNDWLDKTIPIIETLEDDIKNIALGRIGSMISHVEADPNDGIWPIEYIRKIIEKMDNDRLCEGISLGRYSSGGFRSINTKNPTKYWEDKIIVLKRDAQSIRFQYPKTAAMLEKMVQSYEWNAKQDKIQFS